MCGILGFVGQPDKLTTKEQSEFHRFMSYLFWASETRGRDASGFAARWPDDRFVYDKKPCPGFDFSVRSYLWRKLTKNMPQVVIAHTRQSTQGDPGSNINNHPHVGNKYAMVHNGCVSDHKDIAKKHNLVLASECDSEILLRLFEFKDEVEESAKFMLKETEYKSSLATAFISKTGTPELLIVRNDGSPCTLFKASIWNNIIIFVSTVSILRDTTDIFFGKNQGFKEVVSIDTIPPFELFRISPEGTITKKALGTFGNRQKFQGMGADYYSRVYEDASHGTYGNIKRCNRTYLLNAVPPDEIINMALDGVSLELSDGTMITNHDTIQQLIQLAKKDSSNRKRIISMTRNSPLPEWTDFETVVKREIEASHKHAIQS